MKTFYPKKEIIKREWYEIDATGQNLGRLASKIAFILKGKHKTYYYPNVDCGDFVVVTNADKIVVTGKKVDQKLYIHHTMHPGGLRIKSFKEMLNKFPERIIKKAVWGMLPHNRLGRQLIKKLKVYKTSNHPHIAQQPQTINLEKIK